MPLLATLSDIVKGCPRNIKRRLLRDILLIVFVTSGAILSIVFFQGVKTQHDFSNAIIDKANIRVSSHFQSFTDPLGHILKLLGKWGESGLLKVNDPNLIATQFQALMEIQPTIHSISIADTKENNIQLSHHNDDWLLEDSHADKATLSAWINGKAENERILNEKRYSMSTTNWFRGAITLPTDAAFFLTEPYLHKTTAETVITASLYWTKRDDPNSGHVSAVSFTIESLMRFIEELRITPNSSIFLFEKDGTLLSYIAQNSINPDPELDAKETKITATTLDKISSTLRTESSMDSKVISIKDKGNSWWVGISPLHTANNDVVVAVVIPEDDIFSDLRQQWIRFALIVGSIFLLGIVMTVYLVKKYSHQLKDLPQQHVNTHSYVSEVAALISAGESTTLEFKSTMRTNLRTGKPGKEIEIAWLKTVVGFMNSDGGILLIGVDDSGAILGTDADKFANEDKCRLHFKNMLNTHIGAEFTRFIHLKVVDIDEKSILIIECERVRRPVFLSMGKQEDFFIRSGPSSMKLTMSQMVKYLGER